MRACVQYGRVGGESMCSEKQGISPELPKHMTKYKGNSE